jgi:hypothetical protein
MIGNINAKLGLGFLLFEMHQVFDPSEVEIHAQATSGGQKMPQRMSLPDG